MKIRFHFFVLFAALSLSAVPVSAHVGSPDVFFEGNAGPYRVFVSVLVPQVVPGVAEIQVRSESGDVREVRVVPMRLAGPGSNLPPTPDVAAQSKDDPQFFTASLWLMESGALQVRVSVDGAQGHGEVSVPVPSSAQHTLPMQKPLAALLFALMLLLAAGVVFIVGAITREGNLDAGEAPSQARERRARRAMAVSAVIVFALLYFGKAWWNVNAADFQRRVNFFKPPAAALQLLDGHRLEIRVQRPDVASERGATRSAAYLKLGEVIPDHGHLMHLFLVRSPGLDAIWHLHPNPANGDAFVADLPDVPTGRYQVFADVVDPRGFPWTLVGSVDLPNVEGKSLAGDDSGWSGAALDVASASDATLSTLPDGGRIVWQRPPGPLKAGVPSEFTFVVQDKNGQPVRNLEPYMGMAGHAEFVRSDFSVFAHVHPAGSVSMAALELAGNPGQNFAGPEAFAPAMQRPMSGSMPGQMSGAMAMSDSAALPPTLQFPYGFPQPGEYRIFVQVKRAGNIETGVFDAHVQ